MKKINLIRVATILAATATVFTACNKDSEEFPAVRAEINAGINGMTDAQTTPSSRAAETFWAAGDAIGVTATSGTAEYNNICYKTTDGNGDFSALPGAQGEDNSIYFQTADAVSFSAYYPYTGANGAPAGIVEKTLTAADQTAEAQPAIDYLFGTGSGSSAAPIVSLKFDHCMSRVVLKFKQGEGFTFPAGGFSYTLSGLKMKGSFNTADGKAEADAQAQPAEISMEVAVAEKAATITSSPLILFPQASTKAGLKVDIEGVTYSNSFNISAEGLKPAHTYTYNVTVNRTAVTISEPIITDWTEGGGEDIGIWN